MDASKDSTGSSKHVSENNFNKDLNGMILFGKHISLQLLPHRVFRFLTHSSHV